MLAKVRLLKRIFSKVVDRDLLASVIFFKRSEVGRVRRRLQNLSTLWLESTLRRPWQHAQLLESNLFSVCSNKHNTINFAKFIVVTVSLPRLVEHSCLKTRISKESNF